MLISSTVVKAVVQSAFITNFLMECLLHSEIVAVEDKLLQFRIIYPPKSLVTIDTLYICSKLKHIKVIHTLTLIDHSILSESNGIVLVNNYLVLMKQLINWFQSCFSYTYRQKLPG